MKQRKETTAIAFRASIADVAEIDQRADLAGMSRAEWIAAAVRAALTHGKEAANIADTPSTGPDLAARVTELERQLTMLIQPAAQPAPGPAAPEPAAQPEPATQPTLKGDNVRHSPEVIARIIELSLQGVSPGGIATRLNEEGLKPAKARRFKAEIVRRLLDSPTHKAQRIAAGLKS